MRRLLVLGFAMAAGAAVGCDDTPRTSKPVFLTAGSGGGGSGGGLGGAGAGPSTGSAGAGAATGGAPATGGSSATGGAGGMAGAGGAAGAPPAAPPPVGLASVNSDYSSTTVSLLNPAGGVMVSDCIASSAGSQSNSKTLSGDVVLPSQPQRGGLLVLVDRSYGNLTFVNTTPTPNADCVIHSQIAVPGGGKLNPHDVVIVSDDRAYVTRYNADPTASSVQQMGNDVIVMNQTTGAYISRISLDGYAAVGVLARPDRALIANGLLAVSLNQVDAAFSTYGDGVVVLINTSTNQVVASVPLPNLTNCEGMDYIASSKTLLVACGGGYASSNQPLQSGIAVIDLAGTPARLDKIISSMAFDGRSLDFSWILAAPTSGAPSRAFTGSTDPNFIGPDALFQFDFGSGAAVQVTTGPSFTLGQPAVSGDVLFVPEAISKAPRVQLFDVSGAVTAAPVAISTFSPDQDHSLPPRQLAWY
ncbi:MAG TPA: hypothetical protein VMT03_20575 [Polyangia bacterium]|nr:hypothetical protein [Polyangia bacterium]